MIYSTLFTSGGEEAGCRLKPQALGGGAGVKTGDCSGFIQLESVALVQNNSLISNRFRVVSFWIIIGLRVWNNIDLYSYIYE